MISTRAYARALLLSALLGALPMPAGAAPATQDPPSPPPAAEAQPLAPEAAAGTFSERLEVAAVSIPVRVHLPKGAPPLAPEELVVVEGE